MDHWVNSDSESEHEDKKFEVDDRETLAPGRQCLGIDRNYVGNWQSVHGFREFYQNWMDGMMESFKVTRDQIIISVNDTTKEYTAVARSTKDNAIMGYIRFLEKKGEIELTNFKAKLERKHLGVGVSSKRRSTANLAGTHGEGFKVGALVMVRKLYQVRYESSSYYWKFSLAGKFTESLYCKLSRMSPAKVNRLMANYQRRLEQGLPRELKANIWEDTTVRIGDVYGRKTDGKMVEDRTFREWIKVALALDSPSTMIKTPLGDLILDDGYKSRVYLKGLRLSKEESFKFAYNLAQGSVNRDRERLVNAGEEAENITNIWAFAIKSNKDIVLPKYVQMLRNEETKPCGDIAGAKDLINQETTELIWDYLRESEGNEAFFYEKKEGLKCAQIIQNGLKKNPVALPETLWGALLNRKLVRTPKEEQSLLLQTAPRTQVQRTLYSKGMDRALKAALALDQATRNLKVIFKAGAESGMDLLLHENSILIHEKWLDFKRSHRNSPCFLSEKSGSLTHFDCDHIILKLHEMILAELRTAGLDDVKSRERDAILRQRVNDNFRQMPRNVQFDKVYRRGELTVCWTDTQSQVAYELHELKLLYEVVMHRVSTCGSMHRCLLNTKGMDSHFYDKEQVGEYDFYPWTAKCGCPAQALDRKLSQATFSNLDPNESYFPLVMAAEPQSVCGVPPEAIKPTKIVSEFPENDEDMTPGTSTYHRHPSSRPKGSCPIADPGDRHFSDADILPSPRLKPLDTDHQIGRGNEHERGGSDNNEEINPGPNNGPVGDMPQNTTTLGAKLTETEDMLQEAVRTIAKHTRKIEQISKERDYVESRLEKEKRENEEREKRDESTIEDLLGENKRRREVDVQNNAKINELTTRAKDLEAEIKILQSATQNPRTPPGSHSANPRDLHDEDSLLPSDEEAPSEILQARKMIPTLLSASRILQGALMDQPKEVMVITIKTGVGMIQGLLEAVDDPGSPDKGATPKKRKHGGNDNYKSLSSPDKKPRIGQ